MAESVLVGAVAAAVLLVEVPAPRPVITEAAFEQHLLSGVHTSPEEASADQLLLRLTSIMAALARLPYNRAYSLAQSVRRGVRMLADSPLRIDSRTRGPRW